MSLYECERYDCDICNPAPVKDPEPLNATSEELYGEAAGAKLNTKLDPDKVLKFEPGLVWKDPGPLAPADAQYYADPNQVIRIVQGAPNAPGTVTPETSDYFIKKNDQHKPRMSLLPFDALVWVAKVLTFGAKKYSPESWRTIPDALDRYEDALLRHSVAIHLGEEIDPESGLPHQAHRACDALFCCALACAKYAKNSVELLAWGSGTAKF